MTNDASKSPEQVFEPVDETPAASPPGDHLAAKLRGFGPLGILAMLVIVAFGGLLGPLRGFPVLAWAGCSRTPWRAPSWVSRVGT